VPEMRRQFYLWQMDWIANLFMYRFIKVYISDYNFTFSVGDANGPGIT
jgi:hypothetical protein